MISSERPISLGFTSETFPAGTHICYIYNDEQERWQVIAGFIESGLAGREKVGYFVDMMPPDEMRAHLSELGLDLPPQTDERQFSVARALDTYCPDGMFIPERMLQNLRSMYTGSIDEGYTGARASGEMS